MAAIKPGLLHLPSSLMGKNTIGSLMSSGIVLDCTVLIVNGCNLFKIDLYVFLICCSLP